MNEPEPPPGTLSGGDAEVDALYQELGPGLVRYLRRLLRSGSLAEDIAQDAFLILARKWPEVRNHPCPRAWLYKVARHLAFDTLKERSRELLKDEPDQAAGWVDPWDSHDTHVAVREAVGKLPARQREAVWLFYFCGFKQNEIATIMQIQRNTVGPLLFQARSRLAGLLGA
jgi:RNA polymerase sigma factor (sigma-70 family)